MIKIDMTQSNSFAQDANEYINAKLEVDKAKPKLEEVRQKLLEHVPPNAREVYSNLGTIKRDAKGTLRINMKGE